MKRILLIIILLLTFHVCFGQVAIPKSETAFGNLSVHAIKKEVKYIENKMLSWHHNDASDEGMLDSSFYHTDADIYYNNEGIVRKAEISYTHKGHLVNEIFYYKNAALIYFVVKQTKPGHDKPSNFFIYFKDFDKKLYYLEGEYIKDVPIQTRLKVQTQILSEMRYLREKFGE